jgi:prophage regulatory protein
MSQAMQNNFDALPDTAFVRANSLFAAGLLPFSRATLWRLAKAGRFPKPVKLSDNITAWNVGAVRRWRSSMLAAQVAIADEESNNDL